MHYDILSRTSRFNLSKPQPCFINECCFGDDLAKWLISKLPSVGLQPGELYQEDCGWEFKAEMGASRYYLGVGGTPDDDATDPDRGELRIIVSKRRTLPEKLFGSNKLTPDENILGAIETLLKREKDFTGFEREQW